MIKKLIFYCLSLLIYFNPIKCQEKQQPAGKETIIQIDSLFKFYGVIIDSTIQIPIKINSLLNRFTPGINQIVDAEMIFLRNYNETNKATPSRSSAKYVTNVKEEFKRYNRQYVGFLDIYGDSNIIINLFDYSRKKVVKRKIGDSWKRSFVVVFSENPSFTILTYRVNLKEKKLYATL